MISYNFILKTLRTTYLIIVVLLASYSLTLTQPNVSLFDYWAYHSDHKETLYKSLADIGLQQLHAREQNISSLISLDDWKTHQQNVREKLNSIMGEFPEKTPLNARVTGILEGDGFRVEKVIYESQPGFHVTAALFIPDNLNKKAPAILYCSGHTFESFRSDIYQHNIINLTNKGFIVLAFDPVSQGERLQYLDDEGKKSIYDTPTKEHSYAGGQCFTSGTSMAKLMIWDGIRSIDYLITRPEVDPERIGITGRSGGGTQSVYISAFDDRILASAPECYVNSFKHLLKSIGPQDAEQNLPNFLKKNLDFADYLEVRAPKPVLIISTLNDFFSIQGARDTYMEVQQVYRAFGKPDYIQMSEDVAEHKSTRKNREAMYAFFQKYLNNPGDPEDIDITVFENQDLNATETGQVLTSYQGETAFSLNQMESRKIIENRIKGNKPSELKELTKTIIDLTGYEDPGEGDAYLFSGTTRKNQFTIEKYLISSDHQRVIPVVVMVPESGKLNKAIILLSSDGKEEELETGLPEYLAGKGYYVVLPDITGVGELASETVSGDSYISHSSYNKWYAGILTGKSIVGLRMEDIERVCSFAKKQYKIEKSGVYGIARDVLVTDLLHVAVINRTFAKVAFLSPLVSYSSIVMNKDYNPKYIQSSVYNVLKNYDIPDLISALAPLQVLMVNVKDQLGSNMNKESLSPFVKNMSIGYIENNALNNLKVLSNAESGDFDVIFEDWLE